MFFIFCKKMKYMLHSRNSSLKDSESLSKSKHCRMKCKTSSRSREQLKDVFDHSPNLKLLVEFLFRFAKMSAQYGTVFLLPKLFWPTVRKNCSSDQEKLLRSLEQFASTVESQNNFWNRIFLNLFLEVCHI